MSWYKNNKKEWKEIIDTVANELKRNPLMVEKDTIEHSCDFSHESVQHMIIPC